MYIMVGTVKETIQWCSAFSPSHMDFWLRMTAWGNGARNTKIIYSYKWQSRNLGAREPALFSMPSSPTFSYPIWVTAWTSNGQSGRSRYTPYSPTCTPANSLGILIKPNVWHFRIVRSKSKRGFQNLALSNSKFSPWPSCHIKQVTLSKIQAKGCHRQPLSSTCSGSPLPPLLTAQELRYCALGRQGFLSPSLVPPASSKVNHLLKPAAPALQWFTPSFSLSLTIHLAPNYTWSTALHVCMTKHVSTAKNSAARAVLEQLRSRRGLWEKVGGARG